MNKRTAREILVKSEFLSNKKINVKIGTVENRDFPQTVYVNISFWIKPINNFEDHNNRRDLENKIKDILNSELVQFIKNNKFFPHEKDNIYIYNIPDNFNYNNKYNFISLESYLHTINIDMEKKYSLNCKKDTELFNECIKISNFIGEELAKIEDKFYIKNSSKIKKPHNL